MKNRTLLITTACAVGFASLNASAATTSYSFMAFDQYAGNTPYYSHYQVTTAFFEPNVASIDLLDRGWGYATTGWSSYHVFSSIDNVGNNPQPLRSIGWHQYEFIFNDLTNTASILMDGNTIQSGTFTDNPEVFRVFFHDYHGGTQETVIDNFEYRVDGLLRYVQNFESNILDSNWSITRMDAGTYVASGDPSNPYSGIGALALGATTGGQLAAGVAFTPPPDISVVPEPGNLISIACVIASATLVRYRRK